MLDPRLLSEVLEETPRPGSGVDAQGFLRDPQDWDESFAYEHASRAGLGVLSDRQWRILWRLREQAAPSFRPACLGQVCREVGLQEECIDRLFGDPLLAWRLAGLPNPGLG